MFVLDTNVVSELMRPAPDLVIVAWVAERATSSLFLTAVTEAELRFGLALMPPGKRRDSFLTQFIDEDSPTYLKEAELRFGLALMPPGKRRDGLATGLERMLETGFANRVLPFDSVASRAYAVIAAAWRRRGRPIAQADCQIAAIARARGMAVATRNIRDFEDMGIEIFDPWDGA